ncbi:SMI1/KNR4 family protein [Phenylobacterium immobile]|uniref:SMI1/KNR4 family protein n=1 Tax=Phenylobacterium immobile TaxID=21 RepID=UPI00114797E1|nr:SMI1/KNR4 family protein [Phenylobacterium immobile]
MKTKFSPRVIDYMAEIIGQPIPDELAEFYSENIESICQFSSYVPVWNEWIGFRSSEREFWQSIPQAVPLFSDGCGSIFGLDLQYPGPRHGVYFFDHIDRFKFPSQPVGSSLATSLLILGDWDRALQEGWPDDWMEKIDPEIKNCLRVEPKWGWPED